MKVTELRIGNLLLDYNNNTKKVAGEDLSIWDRFRMPKGIKPIPLTEEWLIKFGFIENQIEIDSQSPEVYMGECVMLTIVNGGASILSETKESEIEIKRPKYVHQLQNLYHALTGQELTIKEK